MHQVLTSVHDQQRVDRRSTPPGGTFATVPATTDSAFRKRIKTALTDDREHTDARIAGLVHTMSDFAGATESASEDDHDEDAASMAIERSQTASLLEAAREHSDEIASALKRLESGAYGVCENCGKEINPERLEARPVARLCITCASAVRHS